MAYQSQRFSVPYDGSVVYIHLPFAPRACVITNQCNGILSLYNVRGDGLFGVTQFGQATARIDGQGYAFTAVISGASTGFAQLLLTDEPLPPSGLLATAVVQSTPASQQTTYKYNWGQASGTSIVGLAPDTNTTGTAFTWARQSGDASTNWLIDGANARVGCSVNAGVGISGGLCIDPLKTGDRTISGSFTITNGPSLFLVFIVASANINSRIQMLMATGAGQVAQFQQILNGATSWTTNSGSWATSTTFTFKFQLVGTTASLTVTPTNGSDAAFSATHAVDASIPNLTRMIMGGTGTGAVGTFPDTVGALTGTYP